MHKSDLAILKYVRNVIETSTRLDSILQVSVAPNKIFYSGSSFNTDANYAVSGHMPVKYNSKSSVHRLLESLFKYDGVQDALGFSVLLQSTHPGKQYIICLSGDDILDTLYPVQKNELLCLCVSIKDVEAYIMRHVFDRSRSMLFAASGIDEVMSVNMVLGINPRINRAGHIIVYDSFITALEEDVKKGRMSIKVTFEPSDDRVKPNSDYFPLVIINTEEHSIYNPQGTLRIDKCGDLSSVQNALPLGGNLAKRFKDLRGSVFVELKA